MHISVHEPSPLGNSSEDTRSGVGRRSFLLGAAATVGAASAATIGGAPALAAPRWAGHKPGKVYFGVACAGNMAASVRRAGGQFGANRLFFRWNQGARETKMINSNHKAGRLPWISFKPPTHTKGIFKRISSGAFDSDIRARARRYAALKKPVIVTFNHEPHTDLGIGTAAEWVKAWCRIHDVMKDETNLKNVASVPILGSWVFDPINRRHDPDDYATPSLLKRCSFLGLDVYQTKTGEAYDERMEIVRAHNKKMGYGNVMLGIGETGAANNVTPGKTGDRWWKESWKWVSNNKHKIGIVCYFDLEGYGGLANTSWHIDETWAKRREIRTSRASTVFL